MSSASNTIVSSTPVAKAKAATKSATTSAKDSALAKEATTLAQQYQRKTDKQHILDNPDTYIGSIENVDAHLWVWKDQDGGGGSMTKVSSQVTVAKKRGKASAAVVDDAMSEVSVSVNTGSVVEPGADGPDAGASSKLVLRTLEYIPGLYKLFDEGIVNCRDHVIRMMQQNSAATSAQEAADKR
jgi:hypothetical protein